MPSLSDLRNLTANVEIPLGESTVIIRPLLERISQKDEKYSALLKRESDLRDELTVLFGQFNNITEALGETILPTSERLRAFRDGIAAHFGTIAEKLNKPANVKGALAAVEAAAQELEEFELEMVPDEEIIQQRADKAKAEAEEIKEKLEALTAGMKAARLDRLVYLLDHENGWDITDGDKPWPPTKENIDSLHFEGLVDRMLTACEESVGNFFQPPQATINL